MPEGKSEIPADIMKAAHSAVPKELRPAMLLMVAKAIDDERQRCIKAAEAIQTRSDDYNGAFDGIADVIEAIRTPPSSTEENLQYD